MKKISENAQERLDITRIFTNNKSLLFEPFGFTDAQLN